MEGIVKYFFGDLWKSPEISDYTPACPALGRDRLPAGRQGAGGRGLEADYTDTKKRSGYVEVHEHFHRDTLNF